MIRARCRPPARRAAPPCANYKEFLQRLAQIETPPQPACHADRVEPIAQALDDLTFLRWSRDFLVAVVAPATVQSIRLTKAYLDTRARNADFLRSLRDLCCNVARCFQARDSAWTKQPDADEITRTAVWLSRSAKFTETISVLVTFAAIMISTYVTTSTYILSQDQKAVADFRNIAQRVEDLQVSVIQTSSEDRLLLYDYVKCDRLLPASSASIRQSPQVVPVDLSADASKDRPDRQAVMQTREEQILVVKLAGACRQQQRAQMKLLTEGGRLRSWDSVLIQHPVLAWVSNSLLGWSDGTMKEIGALMSGGSCQGIATTLGMVEEAPDGASPDRKKNCGEILRYLVKDSPSMASSILGSLTLYVLPCLYGYLSAVAATLFDLRSKISASLLSFTDRGQSIHDQIMGILFGAVIGLFADQLSGVGSSHGLAVSALALLAGFMSRAWWRS